MTISKLSQTTIPSPNFSDTRVNVSKITVHHMAGNLDVWSCGNMFARSDRNASSNYGIDSDGRIACYVPEEYRSWCSASAWNDNRAITIEVANTTAGCYDGTWAVSDKAWNALIELCADICSRYGFELEFTGDPYGSLTRHNFYASTNCPGPYIEKRTAELCRAVNAKVRGEDDVTPQDKKEIAQMVWEYIYKQGTPDQDDTLGKAYGSGKYSNGYNVLRAAFVEAFEGHEATMDVEAKVDALLDKIGKLEIGDVTVEVDYEQLAKAVADEIFARMKE